MPDYDIIVIGCGPAGANFLRLLNGSFKTAVIDKSDMPGTRPKPCGGLLSPDAQRCLASYGLTLPKEILVTPQIFAVKTIDFTSHIIRHYQRSYLNMDRRKFDCWLRSLIPKGISRISARCTQITRSDGGFCVRCLQGGKEITLTSRYIVGADGADSIVRKTFFPNVKIRKYIAVQKWFEADKTAPFYSCVFDKNTSDCCSWSISKDDKMLYGGAFALKDSRKNFETQIETAKQNGFTFGRELFTEACMVLRPKSPGQIVFGGDGVILIGEAGGFISPSSLEGISWALLCGEYAAAAFLCEGPVKAYGKKAKKLRTRLLFKLMKCPFMYSPPLRRLVMLSGINSLGVDSGGSGKC